MKGYVVIDNEILDPEAFSEFAAKVPDAMAAYGGRFIVRGGNPEAVEGDWAPDRLVIMEFDSREQASAFAASAEFAALAELRGRALKSRLLVAEGYDPSG
ncbi:MAG: DUF1330 domain-containing protein [Acidimicrobiales bacterium]|nr:DUF1330 domain-containing protein [Acidimicrobiaceae bacterium]MYA25104.1 DUF1330 domain-containing protein [Acidimicrobiales bacterium]MYD83838.1 DUF1330 domain-containing protein [Acidimicrobiales bacterium]MYJ65182.1 DUF1330 domain-containing protein [Acidimicrobiales bacterium]